ncbi:MAG: AAA family ATPase [Deltaproteobacteria bacterium]|nr:AAA family ATPase [Deltaproteobacteria bacterium]
MLQRLYINNYRSFVNFELNLGSSTLLLGRNGSGKTSTLDALFWLQIFIQGNSSAWDVFGQSQTRWLDMSTITFELEVTGGPGGEDSFVYRLEVEVQESRRRARVASETLFAGKACLFAFADGEIQLYDDQHGQPGPKFSYDWTRSGLTAVMPGPSNRRLSWFKTWLRSVLIARLNPSNMAPESREESSLLLFDGSNFASWYRHLIQEQPGILMPLFAELKAVIDGFESLDLAQAGDARLLRVQQRVNGKSYPSPFYELSDGQRILVVMFTVLEMIKQRTTPVMLMIDEPDNYVGLSELEPLISTLCDLADEGKVQFVAVSHHPELLDHAGFDHKLLFFREDSGPTRVDNAEKRATPELPLSESVARGWVDD